MTYFKYISVQWVEYHYNIDISEYNIYVNDIYKYIIQLYIWIHIYYYNILYNNFNIHMSYTVMIILIISNIQHMITKY